jgi:hypothetical protein
MVVQSPTCADAPDATCGVSPAGNRSVFVMTDADPPPARNVVIESHSAGVTCPEL